jgi:hypothetical protein
MPEFATNAAFAAAVDAAFASTAIDDAVRAALGTGVDHGEQSFREETRPADGALNLRTRNWVLRERDIPVIELIGIVGAAAAAALMPAALGPALITALSGFASLCWRTWRKGGALSKAEVAVLGFLEVHGPLGLDGLRQKASAALSLPPTEIDNAVLTLQEVQLRDGDVVPLIRKDAAGQWRAAEA